MAVAAVGLNLQTNAASDGFIDKIRITQVRSAVHVPHPVPQLSADALTLALEAVQSVAVGLVEDLQREIRRVAENASPPISFSVVPPALRVHDKYVQLPAQTPVTLSYSSGLLLLEAPELKLHGTGETVSEAIEEMSEHLEGLVDHYSRLGPDNLTPGGQRIKDKLLSIPGL